MIRRQTPHSLTRLASRLAPALVLVFVGLSAAPAVRAQPGDDALLQAREALSRKNGAALAALRDQLRAAHHPLTMWADYWELSSRLPSAIQEEIDAFYARWPGSYVEDRLRNDWLLELGRRRDWDGFVRDHVAYRMRDDREVACYDLLTRFLGGQEVKTQAVDAWLAQRENDDGCRQLGRALADARVLRADDIWRAIRLAVEARRPATARATGALISDATAQAIDETLRKPGPMLERGMRARASAQQQQLATLALMQLAANDVDAAAKALQGGWSRKLSDELAAAAWAGVGRQAAWRQQEQAFDYYELAWERVRRHGADPRWSDETLAWNVRAALRSAQPDRPRWAAVQRSIAAMSERARQTSAWIYWQARALAANARSEDDRRQAAALFADLAVGVDYHAQLAALELGRAARLPASPPPLTEAELDAARQTPGLQRGLALAQLGLRDEGRREWNFTLRGMSDRELLAAAELACQAADWQICINTSERTRSQIDLRQRYPMPYLDAIRRQARECGLETALVLGLIRQETRFMASLRSRAGAVGLMQVMPATARWTARRIGFELAPGRVDEVDTNLRLGTSYLRLLLDDFGGSQALATAGYNAGPGRPRRWREGPTVDAAAWAENIPFPETRDYVKTVLANASVYAQLLGETAPTLRQRMGATIGPRAATEGPPDTALP